MGCSYGGLSLERWKTRIQTRVLEVWKRYLYHAAALLHGPSLWARRDRNQPLTSRSKLANAAPVDPIIDRHQVRAHYQRASLPFVGGMYYGLQGQVNFSFFPF